MTASVSPPHDLDELRTRARRLAGCTLGELRARLDPGSAPELAPGKGKVGQLIERALGASAGSRPIPDFPELGVELKTIPIDAQGKPLESTFVCTLTLSNAERLEWATSKVREKLSHVLWVPVLGGEQSRIGAPFFWRPSQEQEAMLRADFEEIVGLVAIGHVEQLTARTGRFLQARPKAAHGAVRTRAYGADDEPLDILPRGFYLRTVFTQQLLRDAMAQG